MQGSQLVEKLVLDPHYCYRSLVHLYYSKAISVDKFVRPTKIHRKSLDKFSKKETETSQFRDARKIVYLHKVFPTILTEEPHSVRIQVAGEVALCDY